MKRSVSVLFLALMTTGCSGICPEPLVFGVPPMNVSGSLARIEVPVPLRHQDYQSAYNFLAGCADDGSSLCDGEVPRDQVCALNTLADARRGFEDLAQCTGAREILVYDSRALHPFVGFILSDWIFAKASENDVVIFHGYFPQPVK